VQASPNCETGFDYVFGRRAVADVSFVADRLRWKRPCAIRVQHLALLESVKRTRFGVPELGAVD